MRKTEKINIHTLQEEAEKSEDKEAFTVLAKLPSYRVGAGARLESSANPTFFIEIIVNVCAGHHPVDLSLLEKNLFVLSRLQQREYFLTCEGDGTISCELAVPPQDLTPEYAAAILMTEKCSE